MTSKTSLLASSKLFIPSMLMDEVESLFDFATSIRSGHEPLISQIYTQRPQQKSKFLSVVFRGL